MGVAHPTSFRRHVYRADQRAEDALYYRQVLRGPLEMAVELVRQLPEQAKSQPAAEPVDPADLPATDVSAAYERLIRAVRRSIMLADKLAKLGRVSSGSHHVGARKRILRVVKDTIQREVGPAAAESLHAELLERLDSPDLDDEIDEWPLGEIIIDICRDLGLTASHGTHPWKRRTPTDIVRLCT